VSRIKLRAVLPIALAAVSVASAAVPDRASAASVFRPVGSGTLFYQAGSGETNDLSISHGSGSYTITDRGPGVTIDPFALPPYCSQPDPQTVVCPEDGITDLNVSLIDGSDRAVIDSPTPTLLQGGGDNDDLTAGSGRDDVRGELGDDTLAGGAGDDILFAETADVSTSGTNTLDGGPGDDELWGGAGPDGIRGGADADLLRGFEGSDSEDGGDGPDVVTGGEGDDLMSGGAGDDRIGIAQLPLSGVPRERGDDRLDGGPGDDLVTPGGGPDGGIGDADVLAGGDGRDTVSYEQRGSELAISLDRQANDGSAGEGDNVGPDVERLEGGASDDRLLGGEAGDEIDGSGGADVIEGGGGDDTLDGGVDDAESDAVAGGTGADLVRGSAGDDALHGDAGSDTIAGDSGDDTMQGGTERDQLTGGAGVDNLAGGAGDDELDGAAPMVLGEDGRDRLHGDEGDDALRGGPADDRLEGGAGADDMRGEGGTDVADYGLADQAVNVSLDGRRNDGERAESDNVRTDVEDVDGGGVDDTFGGSGGRNRLDGGAGEDYVDGRRGSDELLGGASIDVVRARDGRTRDTVRCGRGKDFAIVNRGDRVGRDCEAFDNGLRRVPRTGVAFLLRPVRGANGFGPPGMRRTVPLQDRLRVPMASNVDTRRRGSSVRLVSARTARSRPSGVFSGGLFQVRQGRARGSVAELRLRGGNFGVCRRASRGRSGAAPAQRRRIIRRLRGRARGGYRARGRHSAATVRGTDFSVVDRCDGTLTTVRSGVVRVRDFRRRRTVTVRAGRSYLARAPR
jgi:Ca2+-binding RTX toxin-like protein